MKNKNLGQAPEWYYPLMREGIGVKEQIFWLPLSMRIPHNEPPPKKNISDYTSFEQFLANLIIESMMLNLYRTTYFKTNPSWWDKHHCDLGKTQHINQPKRRGVVAFFVKIWNKEGLQMEKGEGEE